MIKEFVPQKSTTDFLKLKEAYRRIYLDEESFSFLSLTSIKFSDEQIDVWLCNHIESGIRYFCHLEEDKITGILITRIDKVEGFELFSLAVDVDSRNKGIGGILVDKSVEIAEEYGFLAVDVFVFADNRKMLRLVIDKGFIPVKIDYHVRQDGCDGIKLRKYI